MAPVFDHPHEKQTRRTGSRRRELGSPDLRGADTRSSADVLFGRESPSRRNRSGFVSLRDGLDKHGSDHDHHDDDDDDDEDDDRQKNRLQDPDGDHGDDGDGRDGDGQRATFTTPSPSIALTAIPAAFTSNPLTGLTSFLPTPAVRTSQLSTLTTSSVSLSSTSISTSTSSQLPFSSTADSTAPPALNPQVVTVSSMTTMTTTSVIAVMSTSSPSSFISSLFPSSTTTQSHSATAAFDTSPPSPTIFISNTGYDGPSKHDGSDNDRDDPPPGGLSPTAEDVLISAGSIGAFILICFVCWMGWRMYKKHERAKHGMDGDDFSSPNTLLAKIPYFGRNQRAWQDLDSADMRGSAPVYEISQKSSTMGPTVSVYSTNSRRNMAQPSARQGPMVLPQLDTNVAYSPMSYAQVNPFSASASSSSPSGTLQSRSAQSPQNLFTQRNFPYSEQQQSAASNQTPTSFNSNNVVNPFASPEDAVVAADFSPYSVTQYGGEGTMQTFATSATDGSQLPGYLTQSDLARTASAAYDPAMRAVYRASELSSISSGFGDGDIIVPPPATLREGQDPRPYSFAKSAGRLSRANSVANRSEAGSNGQRDTIYTTTSEDMPTRYRSVNSWVNQQTGRVERQRQDRDEDVPPVPMLPPEQRLTMMMDDGEEPRRYEDTLSSMPPVPPLPVQNSMAQSETSVSKPRTEEMAKQE